MKNPRFYPILQLLTVECLRINNYILRCNTRILINILTFFIHVALEETRDIYSIYNYIYTPLRKPASMWPIHVLVFTQFRPSNPGEGGGALMISSIKYIEKSLRKVWQRGHGCTRSLYSTNLCVHYTCSFENLSQIR